MENLSQTKIVILGAGKGGMALLELLGRLSRVQIVGVADKDPFAYGLQRARDLEIPVSNDCIELISQTDPDLIVDVTGDPTLPDLISQYKKPHADVLGGPASRLIWDLVQHENQMQAQLFQIEKLASIGTFTSSIVHDINNPLYLILGLAELIVGETDLEVIRSHATEISEAVKRINTISRDLTQYARQPLYLRDSEEVDLNYQIDEALKVSQYSGVLKGVRIVKNYSPKILIKANKGEIFQVLINLMTNAGHAMSGNGSLTLSSGSQNGRVHLEIEDTGCGIPQENLGKIFNPFFTTKPPGQGTGLGLYSVKSIVEKNKGEVVVMSEVGRGTTFRLEFSSLPSQDPRS